jgi:hypothetical protein
MSEQKFTPGPWRYELTDSMEDDEDAFVVMSDECDIAEVVSPGDTAEANARLIAAAPDLLAACKEAYARLGDRYRDPSHEQFAAENRRWNAMIDAIAAAVRKAEGGGG